MKKLVSAIGLAIMLAVSLFAAEDLSGKWAGSFNITMDGETKDDSIYMEIKQKGNDITGTAGPSIEQQWPISNGKLDGTKLTFDVQTDGPQIKFELTLTGGHLKGNAKAEQDGHKLSAVIDAQRKVE